MKKFLVVLSFLLTSLIVAAPVFAQSADVAKVQNFVTSIIQTLVLLAGTLASAFFVWGGVRYISSSGNPETLESAKNTIKYAAVGLVICLAAFVITNIVTQLAQKSFGQ
ncbi:MAG: MMCAP2_0565 family pilin-like conjugal transfer protein [Candidatus Woesebacteria bacterium]